MTNADKIRQILQKLNPAQVSVRADGTIEIRDDEASQALRDLPSESARAENDGTNFLGCINTNSC